YAMPGAATDGIQEVGGNAYRAESGLRADRVIVVVVAGSGSVIAKQGRNGVRTIQAGRQKASRLLIRLIGHHRAGGDVAVMAAQAHHDSRDFLWLIEEVA